MTHDQGRVQPGNDQPSQNNQHSAQFSRDRHPAGLLERQPSFQPAAIRVSRRRTYTLSDVFQDPVEQEKSGNSSTPRFAGVQPGSAVSPSQVCLCQPDPKVPRPRNAFILFRQHHQAEVVKHNPGLANPEISKIIGEYWRRSSSETKERWKNLAEEEKVRHQKQYPEYRYQPKRSGRGSLPNSTETEPGTCQKCGGYSMVAPPLASTPTREVSERMQGMTFRGQLMSPPSTASPRQGEFAQFPASSPQGPWSTNRVAYSPSSAKQEAVQSPLTLPDAKRRRLEGTLSLTSPTQANGPPTSSTSSVYENATRRPSAPTLPRPDYLPNTPTFVPPRAQAPPNQAGLKLAPIRVDNISPTSNSQEALVMSIQPLGKVRTLAKISSPLPVPGPTSPPRTARGAIVAVEGADDEVLKIVITHLRNRLQQNGEHVVKLYYGGNFASRKSQPTFCDWLGTIQSWHNEAQDIKRFVTTIPGPGTLVSPTSTGGISPKSTGNSRSGSDGRERPWAVREVAMTDPGHDSTSDGYAKAEITEYLEKKRKASEGDGDPAKRAVPVAIIPRYQLTLTDIAASTVPISDKYSPVDHWQWMAATWRGIPGPDVTIIVRQHHPDDTNSANSGQAGVEEPKPKLPEVEVRLAEYGAVILRYEKGSRVTESSLRRVGFEVEEWLRGLEEKSWRSG